MAAFYGGWVRRVLGEPRSHRRRSLALLVLSACGAHESPSGTQQTTFTMASFEVPPNAELYECQDVPNPFGEDIAIVETESTMSPGAHHMYAFQIPSTDATFASDGGPSQVSDCPQEGSEFHPYFHLTQLPHDSITYPDGVGRSLKASEAIRLNVHYLNTSAAPVQVGAEVTVRYVEASAVQQLAAGIFVIGASVQVPAGASTQSFSYPLPVGMKLLQFTGHMHSRGTSFVAHATSTATGEVRPLYSSGTWDQPVQLDFAPPFDMKASDTVGFSCTYENRTGMTLSYGNSAATNEMCNFFGVFYPAANGDNVVGYL
jgi:Copper type II ascorbate-dependent monooxygenase, C-terminal domain